MKSIEENKYWIWISSLKIRRKSIIKLLRKYKSIEEVYNSNYEKICNEEYLNEFEKAQLISMDNKYKVKVYIQQMKIKNINMLTIDDNEFPVKLKNICDYPLWLYYIGNANILCEKSVAIVGSRQCTYYGSSIARNAAKELANKGIYIVSGLAKGIDTYAHIGAIASKARTIAVLGSRTGYTLSVRKCKTRKEHHS